MGYGRQGGGERVADGCGCGAIKVLWQVLVLGDAQARCYQEPSLRARNRKIWKYRDMLHATSNRGLRGRGLYSLYAFALGTCKNKCHLHEGGKQVLVHVRGQTTRSRVVLAFFDKLAGCKSLLPKIRQLYLMAGPDARRLKAGSRSPHPACVVRYPEPGVFGDSVAAGA